MQQVLIRIGMLTVIVFGMFGLTVGQDVTPLAYGEAQTVSGPVATFTFEGEADTQIFIHAQADEVAPTLTLLAPNGALIGAESIYQTGLFSLLMPFALPQTGRYTLAVNSPTTGDMTVLVGAADVRAFTEPLQTYDGQFSDTGDMAVFSVMVAEPRLLTYDILCDECAIYTLSPSGFIEYDGYYPSPSSEMAQVPETGLYTVLLHNTATAGDYALQLNQVTPMPLVSNNPVAVALNETGRSVYAFEAEAGKTWEISADIPTFAGPSLSILRYEGREPWEARLAADYGSGPNGTPRISGFTAPENGTYYVLLRYDTDALDLTAADYSLRLNPASIVRLAPGTPLQGSITPETGRVEYFYEGRAGETLQITFERLSPDGAPALLVLGPSDEVLRVNGRGIARQISWVELPEDGTYTFAVADDAYDPGEMRYSLQIDLVED